MAAYVQDTRQRLLRGMGATYALVPRRRTLRGMGQSTEIDYATGLPCDDPRANCAPDISPTFPTTPTISLPTPTPPVPPSFFTFPKPIIPAPVVVAATPPDLGPKLPGGVQVVFPSQGTVPPPPRYAAAAPPGGSWLDQQMIAGIPNSYLALGIGGLVLLVSIGGKRRR